MPLIIFILMYITGVMLSFAGHSNIKGFHINTFVRFIMFIKPGKGIVFTHTLLFQGLNMLLFAAVVVLYLFLNENEMSSVYNIYKWISLSLFALVMITAAIDTAVLERNGKGNNNENN